MKKWKSLLLIGAVCTMCALPAQAAENNQLPVNPNQTEFPMEEIVPSTPVVTPEITPEPAKKNGWVTLSKGRKRYYKDGVLLKGWHKIDGKTYYFFKDSGTMATKWRVLEGKKYYFGTDGVCRKGGVKQVGKRYFYFDSKGVMRKNGPVKAKGRIYHLDKNGAIEARQNGNKFYYPNGKRMSQKDELEYGTMLRAESIVAKITNSKMTKAQKMEKCFRWVMSKYYRTPRRYARQTGWTALYANDHFIQGSGNCFSDACAFAYLAKAIGCKKVYVCVDTNKVNGSGHSWAEVDGLVYDPLFAEAKSFYRNYGVRYGTYQLRPLYKEAVK